jgi:hypothetical protein
MLSSTEADEKAKCGINAYEKQRFHIVDTRFVASS